MSLDIIVTSQPEPYDDEEEIQLMDTDEANLQLEEPIMNTTTNIVNQEKQEEQKQDTSVSIGKNTREFIELPESINDFAEMKFLSEELWRGIDKYGFKYPSPIQSKTIHIINSGCDLIAQSQSGSGKTGAFAIGSLSRSLS